MSARRLLLVIPLVVFAALIAAFAIGLTLNPSGLSATVLLDEPVPAFDLPPIEGHAQGLSSEDLEGEVSLVNVFGSWCVSCVYEHPTLVQIREAGGPPIYGLAWNDPPEATARWLDRLGDPYASVGADTEGRVAIDFGVTGAPETFVVDKQGVIRYKHVGPITEQSWRRIFTPLIAQLEAE